MLLSSNFKLKTEGQEPDAPFAAHFLRFKSLTLRRDTLVTVLAILVIAITLPFAIVDTIETGRVHLFSKQFVEELPQRFTGPGRLRFILQPMFAIVLGILGGLADVKVGNPHYLFGLLFGGRRRRELLRSGLAAIRNLVAMAIIMDIVFQLILYHSVHPGAAVVIGPILICLPYTLSRTLTTRLAGWRRGAPHGLG